MTTIVPAQPAIQVKKLAKRYPSGKTVLHDVSVTIHTGEFVVIFGPSGVGKSTFLRCLNRLVQPTAGEIWIDGSEISSVSNARLREVRRGIGMIFQSFNLVNRISVLSNVLTGRLGSMGFFQSFTHSFTEADIERAVRALQRAGLTEHEIYERRADTLSGGQRQRVAIARALMQAPKILLADEPVASLDPALQTSIMQLVADIARHDGITVIMSLHHMDLARRYASRAIGFSAGRIVFDGSPGDITTDIIDEVFGKSHGSTDIH